MGDWHRWNLWRGTSGKPKVGKIVRQTAYSPVPGSVFLKRQFNQRGAFFVQNHCPLFASLLVHPADIEVAQGSAAGGPAIFDLLAHPFFDFSCKVL
ncbi:hypothetical protein D5272_06670 [bacterium D16-76]|nr:hypothetical protein [bacterium D16-76]